MKTKSTRVSRRRHELLREFFACAVVLAAIKADLPNPVLGAKNPSGPSPTGRI